MLAVNDSVGIQVGTEIKSLEKWHDTYNDVMLSTGDPQEAVQKADRSNLPEPGGLPAAAANFIKDRLPPIGAQPVIRPLDTWDQKVLSDLMAKRWTNYPTLMG